MIRNINLLKDEQKCSSNMAHNELLEFITGRCCYSTHLSKIQISVDLPVLRSRTGTPGLAGVAETYFPCGIMLYSSPVASGVLSSPLIY